MQASIASHEFATKRKHSANFRRLLLISENLRKNGFGHGENLWHKNRASGDDIGRGCATSRPSKNDGTALLMTKDGSTGISRRALLGAFAATTLTAAPTFSNAAGFLRGAGDIRRVRMYSGRTGEKLDMIYWIEGEYVKDALKEINFFMRDWRTNETKSMDTRTLDIIAATHNLLDVNEPYTLLSGYRCPATNAMLRSSSRKVAKNSLHMKGQAADLRLGSRSVSQIYRAASACNAGGVGKYSRSNFVHMDCGPIRSWGA